MENNSEYLHNKDMKKSDSPAYAMPRGIEVLVKKASVDAKFRKMLLEKRAEAAKEIDLEIDKTEADMLAAIPREQLEKIIENTKVPPDQKPVFKSKFGKIMLWTVITGTVVSVLSGIRCPSFGHTLTSEQKEYIEQLHEQKERERQIQEMNEPNQVDLKAETDSNE